MVINMKYIIDLDAFKECMELLRKADTSCGMHTVYIKDVKALMDVFPKEEYKENWEIEQKGREAGLAALDMIHQKRKEVEQRKVNSLTPKMDINTIYNPLTSKL